MADNTSVEEKPKEETKNEAQQKEVENAVEAVEEKVQQKEMKCIVLSSFGGLKSVKIQNKPEPTPGKDEVLIHVKACGLNFLDVMARQGTIDNTPKLPIIMGFECAGEITAVGDDVTDFQVGDRVAALTQYKAWAEYAAVPMKFVYKIPQDMKFQDAAALLMNYVVAYGLVFDTGCVRKGQTVLIHSAGGGVGQAVSQLVKTIPDVTLIGTASKHKHDSIKDSFSHLIDHGVDYVQEVKKIAPDGIDVVLDCLCGEDANKGYSLLKPLGRYILYGNSSVVTGETKSIFSAAKNWWQVDKLKPLKLFDENRSVSGFHLRHLLYKQNGHGYVKDIVDKIFDLWQNGKIKPAIDSTWAFEDIPEAMQKLHDRKNIGKITLDPAMEPKPKPVTQSKKEKEKKDAEKVDGKGDVDKSGKGNDKEAAKGNDKEAPKGNDKEVPKDNDKEATKDSS